MTETVTMTFRLYRRLQRYGFGRRLFSRAIVWKAPYFRTIRPTVQALRPGYAEVSMRQRRAVQNHIGTVHAIAVCNLAELAAGMLCEATVPTTHRWIPKGMSVEYLRKASGRLRAIARAAVGTPFGAAQDYPLSIEVLDAGSEVVLKGTINIWVTERPGAA